MKRPLLALASALISAAALTSAAYFVSVPAPATRAIPLVDVPDEPHATTATCPPLGNRGLTEAFALGQNESPAAGRLVADAATDLELGAEASRASAQTAAGASISAEPTRAGTSLATGIIAAPAPSGSFGYAATWCQGARREAWFMGGDSRSDVVLTVTNPSREAQSVSVSGWGSQGEAPWAKASLNVEPLGTARLSLSSLNAGEDTPVWKIVTTGVGVVSSLTVTTAEGLHQRGYSTLPPLDEGRRLTLPTGRVNAGSKLRILNPTSEWVTATISARHGARRDTLLAGDNGRIGPGSVVEIPLDAAESDETTLEVVATGAVVAAAQVIGPTVQIPLTEGADVAEELGADVDIDASDQTWVAPVEAGSDVLLAVPQGTSGRIVGAPAERIRLTNVVTGNTRSFNGDVPAGLYRAHAAEPYALGIIAHTDSGGIEWLSAQPLPAVAALTRVSVTP
ncbi:MAG: DUF5719 family protein [Actinomycetaceae bacterium]|nr:DUF5719 family protein [Actinomycetaceae bacterium]